MCARPEFLAVPSRFAVDVYRDAMSRASDFSTFETVIVEASNPIHAQIVARNSSGASVAINPRKV